MPLDQNQQIGPIAGFLSPSLTGTDPAIPYLPLESPDAASDSPLMGGRSRSVMASIVAAWSIVTVAPLWAAVLLQPVPVDAPPPGHEARTQAVQAQVVETWTPAPHESQRRRTLPQEGIAVPATLVPTSTAQRSILLHYTPPGVQPVWKNAILQPVLVDPPPQIHPSRTAQQPISQWSVPTWETQRRVSLPQAGTVIEFVPCTDTAHFPISQWPQPSWDAQQVRTLPQEGVALTSPVPFTRTSQQPIMLWESPSWDTQRRAGLTVSVDLPMPLHAGKDLAQGPVWQWPSSEWPAQSVKPVPQSLSPSASLPGSSSAAQQRVVQSHYAPPVMQPLWASVLLQPVPVDPPPSSHPARTSAIQIQQQASWITLSYEVPSRRLVPQAGAVVASVPFVDTAQQPISQWATQGWEAQRRPFLPPGVVPADAPVPRVSSALLPMRHWSEPAWEITARRVLIQPAAVTQVPSIRTNQLPIALTPAITWETQRRPSLILLTDPVPFTRASAQPIAVSDGPTWGTQNRPRLIVSVDPPPSLSRASHAIIAQWEPITWTAQDRGRLTVQSLALSSVRYIRVTDLSGSLASCAMVVGTLPTATPAIGVMPTGVEVTGALSTASAVTGTLPTATNITGVL